MVELDFDIVEVEEDNLVAEVDKPEVVEVGKVVALDNLVEDIHYKAFDNLHKVEVEIVAAAERN